MVTNFIELTDGFSTLKVRNDYAIFLDLNDNNYVYPAGYRPGIALTFEQRMKLVTVLLHGDCSIKG